MLFLKNVCSFTKYLNIKYKSLKPIKQYQKMAKKLRTEVIERLNGRPDVKKKMYQARGVDQSTLYLWLKKNQEDGPLTSISMADIIASELLLKPEDIYIEIPPTQYKHDSNAQHPIQRVS